jgi:tetratricopeptide (TPR) repeat protein
MRIALTAAAAALALCASTAAPQPASSAPSPAAAPLGEVAFANSGKQAAQAPFLSGLALLHNFEYARAAAAFRKAETADPAFVMAWWGEAMTFNHPVWMEQDKEAGEAVLAHLGATREERLAKAKTPRERAYLEAVDLLYGPGSKDERDRLYSDRMGALFAAYPNDVDARAFYALSLLGLAHNGRDNGLYMRAASLLEPAFATHPRHPGIVHYLIHSYDDPPHARLGLKAARVYGAIAPDAGHALHMTSHIYLALGMWPEVEQANVQAMQVVNGQRAAQDKPALHCGHYPEWLVYARLQREEDARDDIAACRAEGIAQMQASPATGKLDPYRSSLLSWADMATRLGIETGALPAAPPALPDGQYLETQFTLAYAGLLAAGVDLPLVRAAHARLRALQGPIVEALPQERPNDVDTARRLRVVLLQADGLETVAAGDPTRGIAALRAAAEAEAAIPAGFGPPLIEKPSQELLGDALLRLGRFDEAATAYAASLAAAPNRRLSVRGLALARQHRKA